MSGWILIAVWVAAACGVRWWRNVCVRASARAARGDARPTETEARGDARPTENEVSRGPRETAGGPPALPQRRVLAGLKVCEGCEAVVVEKVGYCPACGGYRFDKNDQRVSQVLERNRCRQNSGEWQEN